MKNYILLVLIAILLVFFAFIFFSVKNNEVMNGNGSDVVCTMDAKQCPDGSYVGRVPPICEFAPCP